MKTTLTVTRRGVVTLPAKLRHALGIKADDQLIAALVVPEKDRPVLASAIRLECDALVTGDHTHFGDFCGKSIGGVVIHSPRSVAEALLC